MNYKQIIINLLNKKYQKLNDAVNINQYNNFLNIIELSLEDTAHLTELSNLDIDFITNNKLKELLKVLKIISNVPKETIDTIEINSLLNQTKELLINEKQKYNMELSRLDSISNEINNIPNVIPSKIIDFIRECYQEGYINEQEATKLIMEFSKAILNTKKEIPNINDNPTEFDDRPQIILEVNEQELENLEELFNQYGYSYDKMHENERKKIAKYAKKENIRYILQLLNTHHISLETFLDRDKHITELIIFFDQEGLNNIETFLKNNKCSMSYLLSLPSVFFSRQRKFAFKNKAKPSGIIIDPPTGLIKPVGGYENFLYCIELIKKAKGYAPDYQLTDDDFKSRADGKGMNSFLTTSKNIIENNLAILRRYGIIGENELPSSISALIRSNAEYLLDRMIEAGLYEYITKNMSFLCSSSTFPFKWYKIKRAIDTSQGIYFRNNVESGIIRVLSDDKTGFSGISVFQEGSDRTIIQEPMSKEKMDQLLKQIPSKYRVNSSGKPLSEEEVTNATFNYFYRYQIYSPIDIYKMFNINSENGFRIEETFARDYNNGISKDIEEDDVIRILDSFELILDNGQAYQIKKDNLTYIFYSNPTNGWPEEKIIISRQKVLRLCSLLKENNQWINKNESDTEKANILLSVLLKDSIISLHQLTVLKRITNDIVSKYKKNIGGISK